MRMRAAAYIRVSSKSQTLDMQRAAIERAARTDGDQERDQVRREEGEAGSQGGRQAVLHGGRTARDPRDREGHLRQPLPPHARRRPRRLPGRAEAGGGPRRVASPLWGRPDGPPSPSNASRLKCTRAAVARSTAEFGNSTHPKIRDTYDAEKCARG